VLCVVCHNVRLQSSTGTQCADEMLFVCLTIVCQNTNNFVLLIVMGYFVIFFECNIDSSRGCGVELFMDCPFAKGL